jgi:hypothetical protein
LGNKYNNEYSFYNSIHDVLSKEEIIPGNLSVPSLCEDLGIKMKEDINLNTRSIKKICKNLVIAHEGSGADNVLDSDSDSEQARQLSAKTVLDGLNVITVQRDCNNHYDIEYVKHNKDSNYVIMMKEGHVYRPVYDRKTESGLFDKTSKVVKYLIKNGEKLS